MMSIYRYSLLAASLVSLIGCNQASVTSSHADSVKAKQERPIQVIQLESASQQSSKTFTGKLQSVETAGVAFRAGQVGCVAAQSYGGVAWRLVEA